MSIFEQHEELKVKYWQGTKNKIIRLYFYSQKGLALFNEFRYLIMLIFGVYVAMKLSNPVWLFLMFIISVPALIAIGFVSVHYVGKVIDYLNVQFATHWSKYSFKLQEGILEELKKINNGKNNT